MAVGLDGALKPYYRAVARQVGGPRRKRQALLAQLHSDVAEFMADHPQAGAEDVMAYFGTPQDFAASAPEDVALAAPRGDGRFYLRLLAIVAALLLLAWYVGGWMLRMKIEDKIDYTVTIGPAEYEDSMPEPGTQLPWEDQDV